MSSASFLDERKQDKKIPVKYLNQEEAQQLDRELMSTSPGGGGFSVDQLMELAGLSVATAVASKYSQSEFPRILVAVGPGNNGGDGLVAARHLKHFGYFPTVLYPKEPKEELYRRLLTQCTKLEIPITDKVPSATSIGSSFSLCLDAIFGFSFDPSKGIRAPFDSIIKAIVESKILVASVDIPSGWDVERGDIHQTGLLPDMLVSLTAPKQCAAQFVGRYHMIGGRFIPPDIEKKYALSNPPFPGVQQHVEIPRLPLPEKDSHDKDKLTEKRKREDVGKDQGKL